MTDCWWSGRGRPPTCFTLTSSPTPWTSLWRSPRPSRLSSMNRPSLSSLSRWVLVGRPVRELSQPEWASEDMWDSERVREGETPCSNMLSELSAGSGEGRGRVTTNNTITPANSSRHRKLVRNIEIFSHSFNENISRTVKSILLTYKSLDWGY